MRKLKKHLDELWRREEIYWHQRYRIKWLKHRDINYKFFHLTTLNRHRHNKIIQIKDLNGLWSKSEGEIQSIMYDFYSKVFTTERRSDWSSALECILNQITSEMNQHLTKEVSEKEVNRFIPNGGGVLNSRVGWVSWYILSSNLEGGWSKRDHCSQVIP